MAQRTPYKMNDLIVEYNLSQLITENTHFTEHSSFLLDLILVRNNNNTILMSGTLDPLIPDQVRYHCPIMILLKFTPPRATTFKRKVSYYKLADYDKYREELSEASLLLKIQTNNNIDQNIQDFSDIILNAADKSIPNKIVTIKSNDSPWITCHIKHLIRNRKRIYRQFKNTHLAHYWTKYKIMRNKAVKEIRKSKQDYFDKLDRQLSSDNHDPKLFWKTSKQVLNLDKSSSSIPTLKMHNEFAETNQAKTEMLNLYFSSQTRVDDTNKDLPLLEPALHSLNSIEISIQDVKDVLLHLNVSKASGPDLISPRLLKEIADILAYPFFYCFQSFPKPGVFSSFLERSQCFSYLQKGQPISSKQLQTNISPVSSWESNGTMYS